MKRIILLYIFCCFVSTAQAMNKQLVGIVKPKQFSYDQRQTEEKRMKTILNCLNVALYYHGLAREELSALSDKDNTMIIQTSQLEKSNMDTIHLVKVLESQKKLVASNEELLRKKVEKMIVDTVDNHCNIALTIYPPETTIALLKNIDVEK